MWAKIDGTGRVLALYGRLVTAEANLGEAAVVQAPRTVAANPAGWRHDLAIGRWVEADAPAQTSTPDHRTARARAYGEQLDLDHQLEAIVEFLAGDPAKFEALQARIAAIKAAHPKPAANPSPAHESSSPA